MNPRKEIEFPWGDDVILSRPTMARVAEIERKFGAAPVLARRCSNLEMPVLSEMLPALAVMVRGCDGAPKKDSEIIERAFEIGAASFIGPMTFWLVAAYSTNEPAAEDATAGN
jgi:hypothetical protein